jgi:hypothetical protein
VTIKTNGYSSSLFRDAVRRGAQGLIALMTLGAGMALSPRAVAKVGDPCTSHNNCAATEWCDPASLKCKADLANGSAWPLTAFPCTESAASNARAAAICVSGVCDVAKQTCGIAFGDTSCAETTDCTQGICVLDDNSPNNLTCLPCAASEDCTDPNNPFPGKDPDNKKVCDPVTNKCEQCAQGDTSQCPDGKKACDVTATGNTCVECVTSADCSGPKPDCDPVAKVCTKACSVDADCGGSAEWCSNPSGGSKAGTCTPKLPNGEKIPSVDNHMPALDGKCTPEVAQAVCESGACDEKAGVCGINLHDGPCETTSQCNEGACVPGKNTCEPGCTSDSACDPASWCNTSDGAAGVCTEDVPNGEPVPTAANHDPTLDGKCTPEVGKVVCQSGACSTKDNLCGLTGGEVCSSNDACRSNACDSGACSCEEDAHCGGPESGMVCDVPAGPSKGTCVQGCRGTSNKCPDGTCSSTSDAIAACADSGEYIAGAGFCSGSPGSGAPRDGLISFGVLLFFTAAAGQIARRRRESRDAR